MEQRTPQQGRLDILCLNVIIIIIIIITTTTIFTQMIGLFTLLKFASQKRCTHFLQ
jgi:hypothetical protein